MSLETYGLYVVVLLDHSIVINDSRCSSKKSFPHLESSAVISCTQRMPLPVRRFLSTL